MKNLFFAGVPVTKIEQVLNFLSRDDDAIEKVFLVTRLIQCFSLLYFFCVIIVVIIVNEVVHD